MPALARVAHSPVPQNLTDARAAASRYMAGSRADSTKRAYRSDWVAFETWCADHGLDALPASPDAVAAYLGDAADTLKPSTLTRRCASISVAHQAAGFESPTHDARVRATLSGIRRSKGTAQAQKTPAVTADLRAMVTKLPDTILGVRDRALLLLGFAGSFRRSELVGLDVADVADKREGLVVTLRRAKTDQEGTGRRVGIPYGSNPETCPVRALRAWLVASEITEGPLFRPINRHSHIADTRLSDRAVALVVKRAARAAGFDPDGYAGHSLRLGLVTSAAEAGVSERAIMNQTGHRSIPIMRRYIGEGSLFRENAAAMVGL